MHLTCEHATVPNLSNLRIRPTATLPIDMDLLDDDREYIGFDEEQQAEEMHENAHRQASKTNVELNEQFRTALCAVVDALVKIRDNISHHEEEDCLAAYEYNTIERAVDQLDAIYEDLNDIGPSAPEHDPDDIIDIQVDPQHELLEERKAAARAIIDGVLRRVDFLQEMLDNFDIDLDL
jgi:hypothetical protein